MLHMVNSVCSRFYLYVCLSVVLSVSLSEYGYGLFVYKYRKNVSLGFRK